ncbi:sugar ABC transporter substrate-binding protein [Thioclava dalianensis]|uniref:Sugar ABC transporter substrate-binding protein n=1 Tax=Thioclava dalianensis TaxID=1185766 RepID=A0A074TK83_9RHOB|nr:ABC transporter substrate-binding protein [Thioclava dalianensis]KEP70580.1 sugar ABC transporter substrate-binding protein [Thioclava dalianensis]SFN07248.1 multiple sugar transport system substrate-binding protein [Thioclava dalianensis]
MNILKTTALAALMGALAFPAFAEQRTLTFNTDASDPAPKAAFEALVKGFEAKYPDVHVVVNTFDHEGYKTAMRNFLSADPPDVMTWYSGNRMLPFVKSGQFMDISDVYADNNLKEQLASALKAVSSDGKEYGVPYSYYQWGIYYNKDVYKKAGVEVPKTWDQFIENCKKFKAIGVECLTTGTKALWPAAGIFDYLDLRQNGYEFHMKLTNGEIPWTDPRVKDVFAQWKKVLPYTTSNAAAIDWQDAASNLVQGKAANYVMGNFAVATFKEGGMTDATLGFMDFPEINPDIPRAEEAPTESMHIPSGAKNVADAKKFMAYVASPEVQTQMNDILGQLPVNKNSTVADDPYLQAGFKILSTAPGGISQFFDRDAPAQMAKAGMEGFQEFMAYPDHLDQILDRLEKIRKRVYKN